MSGMVISSSRIFEHDVINDTENFDGHASQEKVWGFLYRHLQACADSYGLVIIGSSDTLYVSDEWVNYVLSVNCEESDVPALPDDGLPLLPDKRPWYIENYESFGVVTMPADSKIDEQSAIKALPTLIGKPILEDFDRKKPPVGKVLNADWEGGKLIVTIEIFKFDKFPVSFFGHKHESSSGWRVEGGEVVGK